jgi:putative copper export protein
VLPVRADTIRLFLHVLAATVWVGGQLTLAALVPTVRTLGEGATATVARRFDRIAWPAFAVLVVTGIWNLAEIDVADTSTEYQVTLAVKLVAVAASGIGAALHRGSKTTLALALGGAAAGLGAVVALFLGVLLRTSY